MKAFIFCNGEESVGIYGQNLEIELGIELDEREMVRELLINCFSEIWDDKAKVIFEDEIYIGVDTAGSENL